MSVTDAQIQSLIVLEVGDIATTAFPAGVVNGNIALLWSRYADKAGIGARLQELYTKRAACDLCLGAATQLVDFTAGDTEVSLNQKTTHWRQMRAEAQSSIDRVEQELRALRMPQVAPLTNVEPIPTPQTQPVPTIGIAPDGNDSQYSGDVYKPLVKVR